MADQQKIYEDKQRGSIHTIRRSSIKRNKTNERRSLDPGGIGGKLILKIN